MESLFMNLKIKVFKISTLMFLNMMPGYTL